MHAIKECHRRNILKPDKSTQLSLPLPPRNSSTLSSLPFFKKPRPQKHNEFPKLTTF